MTPQALQAGRPLRRAPGPESLAWRFPLQIHASGAYLTDTAGTPYPVKADTLWSGVVQMTDVEIDDYVPLRHSQGFNACLVNLIEARFSNQSPAYLTTDGHAPFVNMSDWSSGLTPAYWARPKRLVESMLRRGMLLIANPAYVGFDGASPAEGFATEILGQSDAALIAYGEDLGAFFPESNIVWSKGGDADISGELLRKQELIFQGLLSVRPSAMCIAHGAPGSPGFTVHGSTPGYAIHTAYPGSATDDVAGECLIEIARSPRRPLWMLEARYWDEGSPRVGATRFRWQEYQAWFSGICAGSFSGVNPIWHWGCNTPLYSWSTPPATMLTAQPAQEMQRIFALIDAIPWWDLIADTNATFLKIPGTLAAGASRVCPAMRSDRSFAGVYVPSAQTIRVDETQLTGIAGSVSVRQYGAESGAYSAPDVHAKSATRDIVCSAECVVLFEAT